MSDLNRPLLSRFFTFEEFLTPSFIRVVFIVGIAVFILGSIGGFISLCVTSYGLVQTSPALGVIVFLLGIVLLLLSTIVYIILWRLYCEFVLVVFKINENLQIIKDSKSIL